MEKRLYAVAACNGFIFSQNPLSSQVLNKYMRLNVQADSSMYLLAPPQEVNNYEDWINSRPGGGNVRLFTGTPLTRRVLLLIRVPLDPSP